MSNALETFFSLKSQTFELGQAIWAYQFKLRPKQIFGIWIYIKAQLFNEKHGQGTHTTEIAVDKSAKNTPNVPKFICPNCVPKIWIFMKKGFIEHP